MSTSRISKVLSEFPKQRVLLIGDAILDHYIMGTVKRTSPEAPVPVLNVERDEWLPGGAANVARNLAAQQAKVSFVSIRGDDESGERLEQELATTNGIAVSFVIDASRPTPLKTRAVAQGQQMLRFDREEPGPPSSSLEKKLITTIKRQIKNVDGVILSDYGKGVLTDHVIAQTVKLAEERGIDVIVDPKGIEYKKYRGAAMITPNQKEAEEASGLRIRDEATAFTAAKILQRKVRGKAICITMGPSGVAVFPNRGKSVRIPARAREVYDVTGAGDTFISALSIARFAGASYADAAEIANIAAGISVGRSGVSSVSLDEIEREAIGQQGTVKRVTLDELSEIRKSLSRAGRKFVFTNGCFDVFNVKLYRLLEQARALGDVLAVAINSDASVERIKGKPRPLLTVDERIEMMGSLPFVDYLLVFDKDTPNELLKALRPDILVKGDNSTEVVGREIVESFGGEIRLLDLGMGPSAQEIIQRAAVDTIAMKRSRKK